MGSTLSSSFLPSKKSFSARMSIMGILYFFSIQGN